MVSCSPGSIAASERRRPPRRSGRDDGLYGRLQRARFGQARQNDRGKLRHGGGIGRNLYAMAELRTPVICTVIGEGGSGGALAIAVGDVVLMLQYSTYSVISPEGCASILWKSADYAEEAAETLGITAARLKSLGLIDKIISEPLGGGHRDPEATMQAVKKALQDTWRQSKDTPLDKLLETRFEKLIGHGKFKEVEQK